MNFGKMEIESRLILDTRTYHKHVQKKTRQTKKRKEGA